jgi:D-glycero-alpha-D-manno-heptose-7-phosphate kinase
MIISRTPLRLELLGGSTDIEYFYKRHLGRVLCATLDRYVYVSVNPSFGNSIRISYSATENINHPSEVKNTRVRAALEHFGIEKGIEIISAADIPAKGSGLGSSSSFMVGLVNALNCFIGDSLSTEKLAEKACYLEIDVLKEPIGKQDQYAAAYGGLNFMKFKQDGKVEVSPVFLSPAFREMFRQHLMLFYTGKTRSASAILEEQKKNVESKMVYLKKMSDIVPEGVRALEKGDLKTFGRLLEAEWEIKKNLVSLVSNPEIEEMYKKAIAAGAWGGRISGAGGGGFLSLIVPPVKQGAVREALKDYQETPMNITEGGSQIIFHS